MNVGVDTPLDRRASSGTNSCPGNRVRFMFKTSYYGAGFQPAFFCGTGRQDACATNA